MGQALLLLSLWVSWFLPDHQTASKPAFWGRMDSWKGEGLGSLFSAFLFQARQSNRFTQLDFQGCFHNPVSTTETCYCCVSFLHLTLRSNQPNLSAALLKVAEGARSLHGTGGHAPDGTGNLCQARPSSRDSLHLPCKTPTAHAAKAAFQSLQEGAVYCTTAPLTQSPRSCTPKCQYPVVFLIQFIIGLFHPSQQMPFCSGY